MSSADRTEGVAAPTYWLHTWPRRYGFALIAVVAATVLRYAMSDVLGRSLPFLLFYPTIWWVAWMAGLWPGVIAVAASAVSARYLLFGPVNSPPLGLPIN